MLPHSQTAGEVLQSLGVDPQLGLSAREAARRLAVYGPNTLPALSKDSALVKLLHQFTGLIVITLIVAAIVAASLGEWVDSAAIISIVILNGVIGYVQEARAEHVLEALKKLSAPSARTVRDGETSVIPASRLVPGDIITLDAGDIVPADCRVIDSMSLKTDESSLTGESSPVLKDSSPVEEHTQVAERINMGYLGTRAVYGRARAIVVSTGPSTEMGRLANLLSEARAEPTPLQKKLAYFGKYLAFGAAAACVIIFILGIGRGEPLLGMFLTAVSLAVAAIPEGLPAVVTITLAIGVQRMARRHALVRKLPSVETLGSATVIAADKTGTITQNQMTVKSVYLATGATVTVTGAGYSPEGGFFAGSVPLAPKDSAPLVQILEAGVLCNTAELKKTGGAWQVTGDPTEGALLTAALKAGLDKDTAAKGLRLLGEIPFDPARKMMSAVYARSGGGSLILVKGAPEKVIAASTRLFDGTDIKEMTGADREKALLATDEMSSSALRPIALASRTVCGPVDMGAADLVETELVFLGIAAMSDPAREEAACAVQKAGAAGIIPVMITGDHKAIAIAIAKETGIFTDGAVALSGEELDVLPDDELRRMLPEIRVYARVNPEHKLRIVRAWRERGEIIAMTGDGVNDAPALREADIGIAMGVAGTDVAKEASDMVLTDDNFASIIAAVEEGRTIFANIRKTVHYLLSCNIGEVLVLLAASFTDMPLPLLPVQILWMNLVTDGLPALGLSMEKAEPGVMDAPAKKPSKGIVTARMLRTMLIQGGLIALCTLAVYALELYWLSLDVQKARTMAFMVLVFCQMFHAYNCRHENSSAFNRGFFSNSTLNWAVAVIIAGQIIISSVPELWPVFKVTPLGAVDWAVVFAVSVQPLLWMEGVKLVKRALKKQRA